MTTNDIITRDTWQLDDKQGEIVGEGDVLLELHVVGQDLRIELGHDTHSTYRENRDSRKKKLQKAAIV